MGSFYLRQVAENLELMSYPIENLTIDQYCVEFDIQNIHYCFPKFCFRRTKDYHWVGGPMLDGLPTAFKDAILDAMNKEKVSA